MMDNFNKACGIIILLLIALSTLFTIRASAEEYTPPAEDTAQAETVEETPDETHEVIQVQGVQTYDPQLYERLDKMQESIDALTAALTPSEASEQTAEGVPAQDPAPDYTAQLSGISSQLEILSQQATAETAEPAAFEKPFEDYSVTEVLLLVLAAVLVGSIVIGFIRRL
ncbi:hypothetical protein [Gemmiger sp.]